MIYDFCGDLIHLAAKRNMKSYKLRNTAERNLDNIKYLVYQGLNTDSIFFL
ncbi:hypothetical protein PAAL109150_21875 [Paenibacillus alkaliterrae]